MWMEWSSIWPVFLFDCSHSADSLGFVEVCQQQLGEAMGQRAWWEPAAAAVGADEAACFVD